MLIVPEPRVGLIVPGSREATCGIGKDIAHPVQDDSENHVDVVGVFFVQQFAHLALYKQWVVTYMLRVGGKAREGRQDLLKAVAVITGCEHAVFEPWRKPVCVRSSLL